MSVKQIRVVTPGGNISATVPVYPDTTAADALADAGLGNDYVLQSPDGQGYYQADDLLDPLVKNGGMLHATRWAEVGMVVPREVAIVLVAAAAILVVVLIWAILRMKENDRPPPAPSSPSSGRTVPYWRRAGWKRSGDRYKGSYRAGNYRLPGRIHYRSRWDCCFEVMAPNRLIAACGPHDGCFIPRRRAHPTGWRWFGVHFNERPPDVSAGILGIQIMLAEAARRLKGAAA